MNYAKILRERSFSWLFIGTLFSNLANSIANISLVWVAYNQFNSPLVIAVLLTAMQLASLIIGPFMGGFLDMFKKTHLMFLANLVSFTILLIISGAVKPLLMGGTSMVIQDLFTDTTLKNAANSLITMSFDLTYIFGSLLSGLVLALGHGLKVYLLVAVLYLFVALSYSRIKLSANRIETKSISKHESYFSDVISAFKFIKSDYEVILALLMDFVWNMLLWSGLTVLLPKIVKKIYSESAAQYGFLEAMTSVGIVVGPIALHGLIFTSIGFSHNVYVTAILLLFIGVIVAPALVYKTVFTTQSKGILFTLSGTMTSASYPIGIALASGLAIILGQQVNLLFIIFGSLTFIIALIVYKTLEKNNS